MDHSSVSEGRVVEDPASEFTEYTGFVWPDSANLVVVGDDHGGFHGDGEFYLVFDVERDTLEKWLSVNPPWGDPEWQEGAVPNDIAGHCSFGGNSTHSTALSSPDNIYCAQDFKISSIPWHNGRVLAINTKTERVYLSWWDF
jgi:hypothetical protein